MNNFHIYEEVGRGKYSVVYKVYLFVISNIFLRGERKKLQITQQLNQLKRIEGKKSLMRYLKSFSFNKFKRHYEETTLFIFELIKLNQHLS